MFFIILISIIFYRLITYKKVILIKRETLVKFCIYIPNDNYLEILDLLQYQNYPKDLFDVFITSDINKKYKFNVYNYNDDFIRNNNYNVLTILTECVDVNFLNFNAGKHILN